MLRRDHRLLHLAVLIAIAFAPGCKVGESSLGAEPEPDDEAWAALTDTSAEAGPYMHYVSATEIYARIGEKICMWNGTEWAPITDDAPATLGPYFHFVSADAIYAYIGQRICKWDGLQWTIITDPDAPNANLHPTSQFHFVAENQIYAFFGQQICMWDGLQWNPTTADAPPIVPGGMHFVSEDLIYAVIGEQICKWDGLADAGVGAWQTLTADAPVMKSDFVFTSESNIHAVLGQQVCQWDGAEWLPITEDAPQPIAANFHMTAETFYVIGDNGVIYNSL